MKWWRVVCLAQLLEDGKFLTDYISLLGTLSWRGHQLSGKTTSSSFHLQLSYSFTNNFCSNFKFSLSMSWWGHQLSGKTTSSSFHLQLSSPLTNNFCSNSSFRCQWVDGDINFPEKRRPRRFPYNFPDILYGLIFFYCLIQLLKCLWCLKLIV